MVVIEFGYKKFVLSKEKAMLLAECLESAEMYEDKYWSDSDRIAKGMTEAYTYHVYPNDQTFSMKIISNSMYQMAKLAGKPQEK
jgi:hypothetical protein